MAKMEHLKLDAHSKQISTDVEKLVGKYLAIFDWDIPEIDQHATDYLILNLMRKARVPKV
jgi:hypothetical protein